MSGGSGGGFGSRGSWVALTSRTSSSSLNRPMEWYGPNSEDDRMITTTESNRFYDDEELDDHFDEPPPKKTKIPKKQQKPVEIRKIFPETWIFDSFDFDSRSYLKRISITSSFNFS